jgi:hypothetical protein
MITKNRPTTTTTIINTPIKPQIVGVFTVTLISIVLAVASFPDILRDII